jgi:hypothetical protein
MVKNPFSIQSCRVCVWLVLKLLILFSCSNLKVLGVTYDLVTVQSNISVMVPSVVLQNGTDNVSLIYANNTSAKITIDATTSFATYNYTLEIVNNDSIDWNVKLEIYYSFNVNRISDATIILHNNASSSTQIVLSNGNIIQSSGDYYSLAGSSTIYIKIENLKEFVGGVSYFHVYLRIQTPNTTTYTLYTVTFQIT